MSTMASQIAGFSIVYSTDRSGADQRKHQSPASLAFVRRIQRWPVNSPNKGPLIWKCFHLMTSSCLQIFQLHPLFIGLWRIHNFLYVTEILKTIKIEARDDSIQKFRGYEISKGICWFEFYLFQCPISLVRVLKLMVDQQQVGLMWQACFWTLLMKTWGNVPH